MGYTKDRDRFMMECGKRGIVESVALALLRVATTLQRLSEAQCNGDWPADNGERNVAPCSECGGLWVPSVLLRMGKVRRWFGECLGCNYQTRPFPLDATGKAEAVETVEAHVKTSKCGGRPNDVRMTAAVCPDCRASKRARDLAASLGMVADLQGDPRGPAIVLYPANTPKADIANGRARHLGLFVPAGR